MIASHGVSVVFCMIFGCLSASGWTATVAQALDRPPSPAPAAVGSLSAGPIDTPPEARDDCVITSEGLALAIPVLENDWDADGDLLTVLALTQPKSGRVTLNSDGSVTFTPAAPGLHPFTYEASDGRGGISSARAWTFVNPAGGLLDRPVFEGLTDQQLKELIPSCVAPIVLDRVTLKGDTVEVTPPKPGQRVEVEITPGQHIDLQGDEFSRATYTVVAGGLLVITDDGRMVYLSRFVEAAQSERPPTLAVAGGPAVPGDALVANLQPGGIEPGAGEHMGRLPAPAAGPAHGGIFPVLGWLLSRIAHFGPTTGAQAATHETPLADNQSLILAQVLAQTDIAREGQILRLASEYVQEIGRIRDRVTQLEREGAGSIVDVTLAKAWLGQALLAEHAASLRWALAVDRHQDVFGDRLEAASFPIWHDTLPSDLDAIKRAVAEQQELEARHHWRTMLSTTEALRLYKDHIDALVATRAAYVQQFDLGQRSLGDLLFISQFLFEAEVKNVENTANLTYAEAWLLDATDKLYADYVQRPGWD